MRCNELLNNEFALLPEMLAWVGQSLGRTVEDAPDAWCFLRESYLKVNDGRPVKNFERWVYQRDMPGYETTPVVKIDQAIQMWMVQPGKYYDFIAREGKKIGFYVEDKWAGLNDSVAIKVSYFDNYGGELNLVYNTEKKQVKKTVKLSGNGELKTASFFIARIDTNSMEHNFDFVLEAGEKTENIVVSFVRVIPVNPIINSVVLN